MLLDDEESTCRWRTRRDRSPWNDRALDLRFPAFDGKPPQASAVERDGRTSCARRNATNERVENPTNERRGNSSLGRDRYARSERRESQGKRTDRARTSTRRTERADALRRGAIVVSIDPSVGSPAETLLRLLHPPSNGAQLLFDPLRERFVQHLGATTALAVATGGVYKGQGLILCGLMNRKYEVFRVHEKQFQSSIPTEPTFRAISKSFRTYGAFGSALYYACDPGRLGASQTCHRRNFLRLVLLHGADESAQVFCRPKYD